MPSFKSPNQRRFLFAMDKDQQKGLNPIQQKSNPMTINLAGPQNPIPQPSIKVKSLGPTAVPSLPGLAKMPKFGRIRKYFKK